MLKVTIEDVNQRLDNFILKHVSRSTSKAFIWKCIRTGQVRVNKKRAQASSRVQLGDSVRIPPQITAILKTQSNQLKLNPPKHLIDLVKTNCIWEDDYYIALNKPENIACHGGSGLSFGLIELMRHHYNNIHLVHRLDKQTSGCIIFAKKKSALTLLQKEWSSVRKHYCLITAEQTAWEEKHVTAKLLTHQDSKHKGRITVVSSTHPKAKEASTLFRKMYTSQEWTWFEAIISTGRMHQIRAHALHTGIPIVGDDKYHLNGKHPVQKAHLCLHAQGLEFTHPYTKKHIKLTAPAPKWWSNYRDIS